MLPTGYQHRAPTRKKTASDVAVRDALVGSFLGVLGYQVGLPEDVQGCGACVRVPPSFFVSTEVVLVGSA